MKSDDVKRGRYKKERAKEGEERRKMNRAEGGETFHLNPGNLIANRGRRTEWKTEGRTKKNKEWVSNPAALDHLVASYDPHGSYGRPILKHPHPQKKRHSFSKLTLTSL